MRFSWTGVITSFRLNHRSWGTPEWYSHQGGSRGKWNKREKVTWRKEDWCQGYEGYLGKFFMKELSSKGVGHHPKKEHKSSLAISRWTKVRSWILACWDTDTYCLTVPNINCNTLSLSAMMKWPTFACTPVPSIQLRPRFGKTCQDGGTCLYDWETP